AAKLRRAQDRILAARPYGHRLRDVLRNLSRRVNRAAHPLLQKRSARKIEILVVTSDRGLAGAFNANIIRRAVEFIRQCEERRLTVTLSLVGRKGRDFFRRRHWPLRQQWMGIFDRLTFEHALDIGQDLTEEFSKGTFDELYVIYNEFKSAIQQRVIVEKFIPIDSAEALEAAGFSLEPVRAGEHIGGSYLYEPAEDELLEALLPKHFQVQTYRVLLESSA
ncbi:MAG: F0F1 ATP synthase subunit gamma, partial [Nitrospiraceae bacterium]